MAATCPSPGRAHVAVDANDEDDEWELIGEDDVIVGVAFLRRLRDVSPFLKHEPVSIDLRLLPELRSVRRRFEMHAQTEREASYPTAPLKTDTPNLPRPRMILDERVPLIGDWETSGRNVLCAQVIQRTETVGAKRTRWASTLFERFGSKADLEESTRTVLDWGEKAFLPRRTVEMCIDSAKLAEAVVDAAIEKNQEAP